PSGRRHQTPHPSSRLDRTGHTCGWSHRRSAPSARTRQSGLRTSRGGCRPSGSGSRSTSDAHAVYDACCADAGVSTAHAPSATPSACSHSPQDPPQPASRTPASDQSRDNAPGDASRAGPAHPPQADGCSPDPEADAPDPHLPPPGTAPTPDGPAATTIPSAPQPPPPSARHDPPEPTPPSESALYQTFEVHPSDRLYPGHGGDTSI